MLAHQELLVRTYTQVAAGPRGTKKNKARLFVFDKIGISAALIDIAGQQTTRARQTPTLMADGRQGDSMMRGRIPDKFVPMAIKSFFALGHVQRNEKRIAILHAAA
jgi:hypothetical protein